MPISPRPVIFVVGPTAVGKSELAMHLARSFAEIVNADSRQVYRFMDIGTAKPSQEDRAQVPHHLINIIEPDQDFNLALFLEIARPAIHDIRNRGRIPIVTGGTGQYIWALVEGWQVPHVSPDPRLREELEERAGREGAVALHQVLRDVDPQAAAKIDSRNVRRVIRALEVYHATGMRSSEARGKRPPGYRPLIIGLTMGRGALYSRIDDRVDGMLKRGLVEEVRELQRRGYSSALPSFSGVGYRQIAQHLRGELTLEEACQRMKSETHRFARQQYTWFRLGEPRIHWLAAGDDVNYQAEALLQAFLEERRGCAKIGSATQEKAL